MKTIEIQIFKFSELSDKAKQNALNKYHYSELCYDVYDFEKSSIKFAEIFNLKNRNRDNILDYSYTYHIDDNILNLSGLRLAKYIWNNYKNYLYKGKYYYKNGKSRRSKIILDSDYVLTGVYCDDFLVNEILEFIKNPDTRNFEELINDVFHKHIKAYKEQEEYFYSEEYFEEECEENDYYFTDKGEII